MLAVTAEFAPVLSEDMPCLAVLTVVNGEFGSVLAETYSIEMLSAPLGALLLSIDYLPT